MPFQEKWKDISKNMENPFQNLEGHSSNPEKPFQAILEALSRNLESS